MGAGVETGGRGSENCLKAQTKDCKKHAFNQFKT